MAERSQNLPSQPSSVLGDLPRPAPPPTLTMQNNTPLIPALRDPLRHPEGLPPPPGVPPPSTSAAAQALTKSRSSPAIIPIKVLGQSRAAVCDIALVDSSTTSCCSSSQSTETPSNMFEYTDIGLHSESFATLYE